jgi:hypothetical protein
LISKSDQSTVVPVSSCYDPVPIDKTRLTF